MQVVKHKKPKQHKKRIPREPPQLIDQLEVRKTLRFVTTGIGGSTSTSVNFQALLDAWFVAGTATTAYQLFDFVKIHRITMRAVASGTNTSVTLGIEFPGLIGGATGAGTQASDSNLGSARPALVSLTPGRLSQAGQWQASTGATAFVLRATNADVTVCVGCIIDVELSFKNSADVNPAALASAVTGASSGNIYYGGIDSGRLAATWARSVFVPRL